MWFFNTGKVPVSLGHDLTIYPKCKRFVKPHEILWFKEEGKHGNINYRSLSDSPLKIWS